MAAKKKSASPKRKMTMKAWEGSKEDDRMDRKMVRKVNAKKKSGKAKRK